MSLWLCRGCIFETVPGRQTPEVATRVDAYVQQRSLWPCSQEACQVLMSPKLKLLVAALLGTKEAMLAQAFLFNDQVCLSMQSCQLACQ